MASVLGAQEEMPPATVSAKDPAVPGGTSSSDLLSLAVSSGSYKSIKAPLDWSDIPNLAILTGLNGSGKTQLLEAIDTHYHSYKRATRENTDIELTVTGAGLGPHEVLLLQDVSKARGFTSGFTQLEKQVGAYRQQKRRSNNPFEDSVAQLIQQLDADKKRLSLRMRCLRFFTRIRTSSNERSPTISLRTFWPTQTAFFKIPTPTTQHAGND
jgi:hypothetical protein